MKKVVFFLILIVSFFVINTFVRSIYSLWQKQDVIVEAKKDLAREQRENQRLKTQFNQVNKQEFVEEEARNKLFLVKPGEQVVLVPDQLGKKEETHKEVDQQLPFWQQWVNLFFEQQ